MADDAPAAADVSPSASGAADAAMPVVLVTGKSGAGLSTALKALEDLGYEAVDNLPLALVPMLLDRRRETGKPAAIGVDTRTRDFSVEALHTMVEALAARADLNVRQVFVDCDEEVLLRRFTETRRRHPLALDRPVSDGIKAETVLLAPVRDRADLVVNTSTLTIHDLRRRMAEAFTIDRSPGLFVFVMSFAFARGLPREADLVFDVRFLKNPHWDPVLRPMTGLDLPVQQAVAADPDFDPFVGRLTGLIGPLLPRYNQEGKSYLTIAVGCSGGRHRSVYVTEVVAAWLAEQGIRAGVRHRDLPRSS